MISRTNVGRFQANGLHRTLPVVLAVALAAAVAMSGCDDEGAPAVETAAAMTEEEYVSYMAALTVALEEGLTRDAARARVLELGGGDHSREDVEAFARELRSSPHRWAELEEDVNVRALELRSARATGGTTTIGDRSGRGGAGAPEGGG